MRSFIIRPALSSLYQKGQVSKRITVKWCILYIVTLRNLLTGSGRSPPLLFHVRESLASRFHAGYSGFQLLDTGFLSMELELRIPDF